ncbi:MAG: T9SS type A sorting domain-containing protein [Lentimicrobiaceae bacterium]|nr:T9SS type A sorting domain-containing protein [Lentimicrobiaceae bacterium]MCO5267151.1 T9SS type A sorting domain-containing protein [Lentimicrobium sp.]
MKTIKYYFIYLMLLIVNNPCIQAQPVYSNFLLNPLNIWSAGTAVFSKDGAIHLTAIGGGDNYFTNDKAMLIGCLNSDGLINYQNTYKEPFTKYYPCRGGFHPIGDSSYIVIGTKEKSNDEGFIFILDQNFDTIFTKFFMVDTFQTILRSIDILPNSEYILCGEIFHYINPLQGESDGIFLYKTDSLFNLQWYKIYKLDVNNLCFTVAQTTDNGYVIGGSTNSKTNYSSDPLVIKTDSQGNQEWIWQNGSVYDDLQAITSVSNDGNILVGYGHATYQAPPYPVPSSLTQIRVVKMDNNGNELWTRDYGGSYMGNQVLSITHLPDNTYLIGGDAWITDTSTYGWGYTRAFLLKLNENGDSLWMRHYIYEDEYGTQLNYFSHANTGSENSLLLIGCSQNLLSPTAEQSMWIMRLDSLGCDTPECNPFVGVKKPVIMKEGRIRLYPNPANEFVGITIPEEYKSGNFTTPRVRFYDLNGKLVQESIPQYEENSYRCHTHNLSPGIYFVQLIDRNSIIGSNKLLIMRSF